jgi:hypothetical protein
MPEIDYTCINNLRQLKDVIFLINWHLTLRTLVIFQGNWFSYLTF